MYIPKTSLLCLAVGITFLFFQCTSKTPDHKKTENDQKAIPQQTIVNDQIPPAADHKRLPASNETRTIPADWSEIRADQGFVIDIRYATTDNFTKKKIYDCGRCYLRPVVAEALKEIQNELKAKLGYGIKVFDCFRPRPYQQRLWDMVPNPDYVTPPEKGSMHSRGLAVDLTIVDHTGKALDMGTSYDYFGKEAHQDYTGHSAEVIKNRLLLKETMERHGFLSIRTEWWHYSYNGKTYPLDEWVWDCE